MMDDAMVSCWKSCSKMMLLCVLCPLSVARSSNALYCVYCDIVMVMLRQLMEEMKTRSEEIPITLLNEELNNWVNKQRRFLGRYESPSQVPLKPSFDHSWLKPTLPGSIRQFWTPRNSPSCLPVVPPTSPLFYVLYPSLNILESYS